MTLALALFVVQPAVAQDLVGTDVSIDSFTITGACNLTATVTDPGVEFVDAGPDLCMAGPSGRLDVDVSGSSVRWDFTAEQDFGFGGGPSPWLWLTDVNPACPGGQTGTVAGITSVTTNMDATEWDVSLVDHGSNDVEIIGDPMLTGGDTLIRTHPGDFIEVGLDLECPLTVDLRGTCPGVIAVQVSGVVPGGDIGIGLGSGLGSDVIGGGPCAGTQTGLSGASFIGSLSDSDLDGIISATPNVTTNCGMYLQIIDRTTCETSNVELL